MEPINIENKNSQNQILQNSDNLVKKVETKNMKKTITMSFVAFLVVAFGILSGWLLSGRAGAKNSPSTSQKQEENMVKNEDEAGLATTEDSWHTAEGKLLEGGIDGEGTYHLDRGTGPSQFVYLTSTVIDLQKFVGKDVQLWGETISGKDAGWLMDVLKIKVKK